MNTLLAVTQSETLGSITITDDQSSCEAENAAALQALLPADPDWVIDQIRDAEGYVVAEVGRCTVAGCKCEGYIVYWDDRPSPLTLQVRE
jgi:hypothetical protein